MNDQIKEQTHRAEVFNALQKESKNIFIRKNNDYSATIDNISLTGLHGVAVRLLDKVARLHSLTSGNQQRVMDESIRDTLLDIANYGYIGCMLHDGTWENESNYVGDDNEQKK